MNNFKKYKKSIIHIWKLLKKKFKRSYGYDVDHLKLKFSEQAYDSHGDPTDDNKHGGSWTEQGIIYIDPNYPKVWKDLHAPLDDSKDTVLYWYATVMGHELAHEIYHNVWSKSEKKEVEMEARHSSSFHSYYLDYLIMIKKPDIEEFREELIVDYFGWIVAMHILNELGIDAYEI